MNREIALQCSYANFLTKKRYDALIKQFGSVEGALPQLTRKILQSLGCKPETCIEILERLQSFKYSTYNNALERSAINFITIEDNAYPELLRCIADPPVFLYMQGNTDILTKPCIACVGTRRMTTYGKQVTNSIVSELARAGVTIVSGLAFGIDAQVANVVLKEQGSTIAVLANGLPAITPIEHTKLAKAITKAGGLLISEQPLGVFPPKYAFPARNRIIAGLSQATLVLEAANGSGALITAELALDYNRDVFAVPGSLYAKTYSGCNAFIQKGQAQLVTCAKDILDQYSIRSVECAKQEFVPTSNQQKRVYDALSGIPQSMESLATSAKLTMSEITLQLTLLELEGKVLKTPENTWIKQ